MDSNCFGALFGDLCSGLPDDMALAQVASMTVSREKSELQVGLRLTSVVSKNQLYAAEKQLCADRKCRPDSRFSVRQRQNLIPICNYHEIFYNLCSFPPVSAPSPQSLL